MFPAEIETARLMLRPVCEADAHPIFDSFCKDPEVTRFLVWRPHVSVEETISFVRSCLAADSFRTYAIELRRSGEVIGLFDLRSSGKGKLDCGYLLARAFWCHGLMTEALTKVVEWALSQPSIWRISGAVDLDNVSSIRVMEKAGLRREGVLKRWIVHPAVSSVPRDCYMYAATR